MAVPRYMRFIYDPRLLCMLTFVVARQRSWMWTKKRIKMFFGVRVSPSKYCNLSDRYWRCGYWSFRAALSPRFFYLETSEFGCYNLEFRSRNRTMQSFIVFSNRSQPSNNNQALVAVDIHTYISKMNQIDEAE